METVEPWIQQEGLEGAPPKEPWRLSASALDIFLIPADTFDSELLNAPIPWRSIPNAVRQTLARLLSFYSRETQAGEDFRLRLLDGITTGQALRVRGIGETKLRDLLAFVQGAAQFVHEDPESNQDRQQIRQPLVPVDEFSECELQVKFSLSDAQYQAESSLRVFLSRNARPVMDAQECSLADLQGLYYEDLEFIPGVGPRRAEMVRDFLAEVFSFVKMRAQFETGRDGASPVIAAPVGRLLTATIQLHAPFDEVLRCRVGALGDDWDQLARRQFGFSAQLLDLVHPNLSRLAAILGRRLQGETYGSIGDSFGISRERVRQVVMNEGPRLGAETYEQLQSVDRRARARRKEQEAAERSTLSSEVEHLILRNPGISIENLARAIGRSEDSTRSLIPPHLVKFVESQRFLNKGGGHQRWSKTDLLDSVRRAGTFYFPLSAPQYDELVTLGEVQGPGSQTIAKRFGTWKQACEEAGVESTGLGRQVYERKWSWDEVLNIVVEYLLDPTTSGTFSDYERWRLGQTNSVPSGALVRTQMDTWTDAVSYALVTIAEMGPLDPTMYGSSLPPYQHGDE